MRIAVVGAGGVGGGFGAALAKAGADVTFIARGAHLAAMKSAGLKIQGGRGETHVVPTQATDDPKSIGAVDVVLFCVCGTSRARARRSSRWSVPIPRLSRCRTASMPPSGCYRSSAPRR
jgi:ketopantoate reductase